MIKNENSVKLSKYIIFEFQVYSLLWCYLENYAQKFLIWNDFSEILTEVHLKHYVSYLGLS